MKLVLAFWITRKMAYLLLDRPQTIDYTFQSALKKRHVNNNIIFNDFNNSYNLLFIL